MEKKGELGMGFRSRGVEQAGGGGVGAVASCCGASSTARGAGSGCGGRSFLAPEI